MHRPVYLGSGNQTHYLTPVKTDKAEGFVKIQSTGNAGSSPHCLTLIVTNLFTLTAFAISKRFAVCSAVISLMYFFSRVSALCVDTPNKG